MAHYIVCFRSIKVTDKSQIELLVQKISQTENHIDLLVNNAGISSSETLETEKGAQSAEALSKELFNDEWSDWENIYRTNVIA